MDLFDLTMYVETLQFNDPRYTDHGFHAFLFVSTKIFLSIFATNSDSAFLSSVLSVLAICWCRSSN